MAKSTSSDPLSQNSKRLTRISFEISDGFGQSPRVHSAIQTNTGSSVFLAWEDADPRKAFAREKVMARSSAKVLNVHYSRGDEVIPVGRLALREKDLMGRTITGTVILI